MQPLIDTACSLTGKSYRVGDYDDRDSFAMRVLAEHARSSTMLVSDGVFPSNEGRGYVLRRILRRAVRYAYLLGTEQLVMPRLAETAIDVMGNAYPDVIKNRDFILSVLTKEEERFRHTLRTGLTILDGELGDDTRTLSGPTAFLLHDTYGFPLELTQEIAGERDIAVDVAGFEIRDGGAAGTGEGGPQGCRRRRPRSTSYREVVEQFGVTEFLGYNADTTESRVLAVIDVPDGSGDTSRSSSTARRSTPRAAARSATPAPSPPRPARPRCSTRRSRCRVCVATRPASRPARCRPGRPRRRRSTPIGATRSARTTPAPTCCTGRCARCSASTSSRPARGSVPTGCGSTSRHYAARHRRGDRGDRTPGQRRDARQRARAGVRDHQGRGRVARRDRVLRRQVRRHRARARGGQLRRAVWRHARARHRRHRHDQDRQRGVDRFEPASHRSGHRRQQRRLVPGATNARSTTSPTCSARRLPPSRRTPRSGSPRSRRCEDENRALRGQLAVGRAGELAAAAPDGVVVARVDDLTPADLRDLAVAVRQQPASDGSCSPAPRRPAACRSWPRSSPSEGVAAADLIRDAAKAVGGGGGGKGDIATAGGKNPDGLDDALRLAREAANA